MAKLALVGAGHAHMTLMTTINDFIEQGHSVDVIGPGERHYYSGMGPGMLGGTYSSKEISFPVKHMCEEQGATFHVDSCVGVDPEQQIIKLKSGKEISYDVASFNTGSSIVDDLVQPDSKYVYTVKPIEKLQEGRNQIIELADKKSLHIGVVGAGPAGVEVAGNALAAAQEAGANATVRLYHGKNFMKSAPEKVRRLTRSIIEKHGVQLIGGQYVSTVSTGTVTLTDGTVYNDDIIFVAMGVRPRPLFEPSGIPSGPDGGMLVNKYLQSPKFDNLFGGGDCIWFEPQPLDKVGVYAVRQNQVLTDNVMARLSNEPLKEFLPGGDYLLIYNTGKNTGVLHKFGICFNGRLAFLIKDYIDSKFIAKFKPDYDK
ncbi:NAD(P)/FAD-dependent oxidoreductase [Halodesulfovibrio marinisediminis]|uniref:Pyridine nucleotide-disulfide oxidoreductase family protein n=1 Tax=Halodesulfovibrio marinisediminis DSM 17456 TaxID=1121457 RepID=A0A1N6IWI4_9BACT|nr:FAD-dependent oxidoreductase [Halodesulfovibrio marinisediminis]SIO36355.1 pyridine nucleotide-disulfide oxidoreductase family protein [Halodesulfovibrio marinisediminis DSM 17456]